jgi:hypothetical protein
MGKIEDMNLWPESPVPRHRNISAILIESREYVEALDGPADVLDVQLPSEMLLDLTCTFGQVWLSSPDNEDLLCRGQTWKGTAEGGITVKGCPAGVLLIRASEY